MLSNHIDSEELTRAIVSKIHKTPISHNDVNISQYDSESLIPYYDIPKNSTDGKLIFKYLKEELSLDGNPILNLASFVNTHIDEVALDLISDNLVKNLADNDEYPTLIEYQERCITMLGNLWHAPKKFNNLKKRQLPTSIGCPTTGSSEAIMLAGLAMKRNWTSKRKAQGKSVENPNILMATCAQVALEKFANYFEVENRLIEITSESGHLVDLSKIKENIDENTIGIFVIMGSTFTGSFEPVEKINHLLDDIEKETGHDIKIHVDGASGGLVAPFLYPNLKWDFRNDRVVSINTSGHKFGLTTAGLGWVIWRSIDYLPESLRFKLDYLGGVEETFSLNFSRPGFPVIHQYYNFLTFGVDGYTKIFENCHRNARILSDFLVQSSYFDVLSVIHKPAKSGVYSGTAKPTYNEKFEPGLPVVTFKFSKSFIEDYPEIPQSILSLLLRNKGFIVPNYHLPPSENATEILRVVVKQNLSLNLLEKLMQDIIKNTELLIESCKSVRDFISLQKTGELDHELVYDLLCSIASNGIEELKDIKSKVLDERKGKKDKKTSYRGAC